MIVTCNTLFRHQHLTITTLLIPFCKNPNQIYYFDILRIINIRYHVYIESE